MNVGWLDSSLSIMEQVLPFLSGGVWGVRGCLEKCPASVYIHCIGCPGKCLDREECLWWNLFRACVSLTPCASDSSTTASMTSTQSTTPTGSIRSTSRPGGASFLRTNKNTSIFQEVRLHRWWIYYLLLVFCILQVANPKWGDRLHWGGDDAVCCSSASGNWCS